MTLAAALPTLKTDIKAAFLSAAAETNPANFDAAMTALAGAIGDAINTYTTSAQVDPTALLDSVPLAVTGTGSLS